MSHNICCVNGCTNRGYNSSCLFYKFPVAKHKILQRQKWIEAVGNINCVGAMKWIPKNHHVICSDHFIGGRKSDEVISPSYAPTIFFTTPKSKDIQAYNRHIRFMQRRSKIKNVSTEPKSSNKKAILTEDCPIENFEQLNYSDANTDMNLSTAVDKACQTFKFEDHQSIPLKETFVLFGITASGFIRFKSDAHGGQISELHITINSGLVDLLEHGYKVLADKGFPGFKTVLDSCGTKIMFVMSPFSKEQVEFSKEEAEETYNTARVRIHVERIMQRLGIYRIVDKILEYLFSHIDDVIHICCVL